MSKFLILLTLSLFFINFDMHTAARRANGEPIAKESDTSATRYTWRTDETLTPPLFRLVASSKYPHKYQWFDGKEYGERHFPGDDHDSVYRRGVWTYCDTRPTVIVSRTGRREVTVSPNTKQIIAEANFQINACKEALKDPKIKRNAEEAYLAGIAGQHAVINAIECDPAAAAVARAFRLNLKFNKDILNDNAVVVTRFIKRYPKEIKIVLQDYVKRGHWEEVD